MRKASRILGRVLSLCLVIVSIFAFSSQVKAITNSFNRNNAVIIPYVRGADVITEKVTLQVQPDGQLWYDERIISEQYDFITFMTGFDVKTYTCEFTDPEWSSDEDCSIRYKLERWTYRTY